MWPFRLEIIKVQTVHIVGNQCRPQFFFLKADRNIVKFRKQVWPEPAGAGFGLPAPERAMPVCPACRSSNRRSWPDTDSRPQTGLLISITLDRNSIWIQLKSPYSESGWWT